jgi:TRAP-type C4-dicarboxylate transport system permease small subunit
MSSDEGIQGVGDRLARLYDGGILVLSSVIMSGIIVIMSVQVFYRYVLNDSLIWAEETCRYLLVLVSFLFIGAAFQRGDMIGFEFVHGALPRRVRAGLQSVLFLTYIAFLTYISWYCLGFAALSVRFTIPSVDFILAAITGRRVERAVSMYWLYMVMPLGFMILALHFAVAFGRSLRIMLGLDTQEEAEGR